MSSACWQQYQLKTLQNCHVTLAQGACFFASPTPDPQPLTRPHHVSSQAWEIEPESSQWLAVNKAGRDYLKTHHNAQQWRLSLYQSGMTNCWPIPAPWLILLSDKPGDKLISAPAFKTWRLVHQYLFFSLLECVYFLEGLMYL